MLIKLKDKTNWFKIGTMKLDNDILLVYVHPDEQVGVYNKIKFESTQSSEVYELDFDFWEFTCTSTFECIGNILTTSFNIDENDRIILDVPREKLVSYIKFENAINRFFNDNIDLIPGAQ